MTNRSHDTFSLAPLVNEQFTIWDYQRCWGILLTFIVPLAILSSPLWVTSAIDGHPALKKWYWTRPDHNAAVCAFLLALSRVVLCAILYGMMFVDARFYLYLGFYMLPEVGIGYMLTYLGVVPDDYRIESVRFASGFAVMFCILFVFWYLFFRGYNRGKPQL